MPPFVGRATKFAGRAKRARPDQGTGVNPNPPPTPPPATTGVFGGGAGEWFEDFKAPFSLGWGDFTSNDADWRLWGTTLSQASHDPSGTGTVTMGPSHPMGTDGNGVFQYGIGLMRKPWGRAAGFPNGLYEFRSRFTSTSGNVGWNGGSGPCNVLWPGDDQWPGSEVDLGELDGNGDYYSATHWDARGDSRWDWRGGDGYEGHYPKDTPGVIADKYFWLDFHISAAFLQTDRVTYYLDGKQFAVWTQNPALDFAHGGVNHVMGVMNRSWETSLVCDWMRFTPEATMLAKLSSGGSGGGGTGGGGTTPPPAAGTAAIDLPGPGGGSPGAFGIQFQGQSNSHLLYADAAWQFNEVLRALTGLTDGETGLNGEIGTSLDGGTATFDLNSNGESWLRAFDQDKGDPSSWPNNYRMTNFLNWARNQADGIPAGRPVALIRAHTEYESDRQDQADLDIYEAVSREFIRRWRERLGRGVSLTPVFIVPIAYDNAKAGMSRAMRDAWRRMCADPGLNCYMGIGSTMDASSDEPVPYHWNADGSRRAARRMAVRVARWMHDNGYSRRDLSSIPSLGPRFVAVARVAGQANRLDLIVQHDGGNDLIVPGNAALHGLDVTDGGDGRGVAGVARQDASTVRVTLDADLSANGQVAVEYGVGLWTFEGKSNPGGTITDNWHTLGKPVNNAEVDATRMNLQRLRTRLVAGEGGGTTTPGTTPPPPAVARSFSLNPQNPGTRAAGVWNTVLTVAGIARIAWVVQNDGSQGWAFAGNPTEVAVPANGQVPIAANFTANGQFVLYYDAADSNFKDYSGQVTIV